MGLANNSIRGTLPAEWANFKNMTELYLSDNCLSGKASSLLGRHTTSNHGNTFGTTKPLNLSLLEARKKRLGMHHNTSFIL